VTDPVIPDDGVVFDVWGCRGTRNLDPGVSRIGVKTSCYSLLSAPDLFVLDAGKGLVLLAHALFEEARFAAVERVHILLSHSHMDHWEGLKDALWFWRRTGRALEVTLYATPESLDVVRSAFAHPSFVPLGMLATFAGVKFAEERLEDDESRNFGPWRLSTVPLNHFIGKGESRQRVATLGFRLAHPDGMSVAYACDHEPDPDETLGLPERILGASLVVIDSYYGNEIEHDLGHGSMEFAAKIARAYPSSTVLAGHLGPQFTDETIIETVLKHAAGIQNCRIAREGDSYRWQASAGEFVSVLLERLAGRRPPANAATPEPADGEGLRALRHEMKTPINQILGFAELIQEELEDEGIQAHHSDLEKIRRAAGNLLGQVERLRLPGQPLAVPAQSPAPHQETATGKPPSGVVDSGGDELLAECTVELAEDADHILVVDDNELNRDMLSRRLAARGYRVSTAADGYVALDKVKNESFDALLLDVMMPGISGIEVLQTLRKTWAAPDLPVIMATARDNSEDIVEALRFGANDYVTKPLDFPVVLARLSTQLTLKKAKARADRLASELEIRNAFIRKTFGRYLSDDVVATLLETPEGLELGGEKRTVTILMTDLRGFTALTNDMAPEQVMHVLNTYLGRMTEIINRHHGTVDEFIGDAVLALFGAPCAGENDALRAVRCALEMQLAMSDVNDALTAAGLPQIEMGIGLNTGEVVAGNIGSEARTKYGIVGSQVNLTSRVESFTVGGQVLMTEATRRAAGGAVIVGKTMELNAKGFHEPVTVHELLGLGSPFDLTLGSPQDTLVTLPRPVETLCWVLAEKLIDSESFPATLVGLTGRGAFLLANPRPSPLVNLRMRILSDPEATGSDVYAKVSELDAAEERAFYVRFTSLRPEMTARFRAWRDAARGPGR
jgi:adenylate cyclase